MTLEDLIAREKIRDTLARYSHGNNGVNMAEKLGVYTEDAKLIIADRTFNGTAEIRKFYETLFETRNKAIAAGKVTRHFIGNTHLEITGPQSARAWSDFMSISAGVISNSGFYDDTLRKVGDRWLIERKEVITEHPHGWSWGKGIT